MRPEDVGSADVVPHVRESLVGEHDLAKREMLKVVVGKPLTEMLGDVIPDDVDESKIAAARDRPHRLICPSKARGPLVLLVRVPPATTEHQLIHPLGNRLAVRITLVDHVELN